MELMYGDDVTRVSVASYPWKIFWRDARVQISSVRQLSLNGDNGLTSGCSTLKLTA